MDRILHVYRNLVELLAIYVEDPLEYSAIYLLKEGGGVSVASNLQDINGEEWDKPTWQEALNDLLLQNFDAVRFHTHEDTPEYVLQQYRQWREAGRQ